jgi:hypothetical protein
MINRSQLYTSNLCQEIMLTNTMQMCTLGGMPIKPKYQFSRTRWYSTDMPIDAMWQYSVEYNEIIEWCTEQFGPHPTQQDAWSRWWVGLGVINFRDERDCQWFILRWGT